MDSQTRAALWQGAWVGVVTAVVAGLAAVLNDPNLVQRFLAGDASADFWRAVAIAFLTAAVMAAKKYWKWEVPAPKSLSKPAAPRKAKKSDKPA